LRFARGKGPISKTCVHGRWGFARNLKSGQTEDDQFSEDGREGVEWVTPVTESSRQTDAFARGYACNEPGMDWAHGDVRLVVFVGKVGDRLAYRTVAQLERAYQKSHGLDELRNTYHYGSMFLPDF